MNAHEHHQHGCGCVRCGGCCGHDGRHDHVHDEGCRGEPGDGGKPGVGRPGRTPGSDRGSLGNDPLTPGDLDAHPPASSWPGPRKDLYLPFLFLRANPGDIGSRPAVGPFWESPDVLLLAGVTPDAAPPVPPELGQVALAGKPNTVYAHVWNLGNAAAHDVIVEFRWCDPALGINPTGSHVIGYATTHLGAKGSGQAHRVVKCPEPWFPQFVNGGHECLLVRVWDPVGDPMTTPEWDASVNRHLGQRNIHVAPAGSLADQPVNINVGPLFAVPTTVAVQRAHPAAVPWLQQRTGTRGLFPAPAPVTGEVAIALNGADTADQHTVTDDGATVQLAATDAPPPPGTAHVYRVTATAAGVTFGGYTVVVMG